MLITLLTTGGALLLAGLALIVLDVARFRKDMVRDLTTLADIVAQNSTAALSFQDPSAAQDTLQGLKARPTITAAAIYDAEDRLFARYPPDGKADEGGADFPPSASATAPSSWLAGSPSSVPSC